MRIRWLLPLVTLLISLASGAAMAQTQAQRDTRETTMWKHEYAEVNGVKLHYVIAGENNSKTILFLHGFPEFWYGWRSQIKALAGAGFRVGGKIGRHHSPGETLHRHLLAGAEHIRLDWRIVLGPPVRRMAFHARRDVLHQIGAARQTLHGFRRWTATHVPRAQTTVADALANEAIDRATAGGPASVVRRPSAA